MTVKALLAFNGAPNFNPVFNKPLYNERCFVIASAQSVKHIYKQNIKIAFYSISLYFLNGIALFG